MAPDVALLNFDAAWWPFSSLEPGNEPRLTVKVKIKVKSSSLHSQNPGQYAVKHVTRSLGMFSFLVLIAALMLLLLALLNRLK